MCATLRVTGGPLIGTVRVIWEEQQFTGQAPYLSVDTEEFEPPTFLDLVKPAQVVVTIGPAASNTAVAVPDCCALMILSDEKVTLRVGATDALDHVGRIWLHAGASKADTAFNSTNLYFSGNAVNTATVRILYWEKV